MQIFRDRRHAGKLLSEALRNYSNRQNLIVLAIPRGGVPVAYEIAKNLHLEMNIFHVRKLGVPDHEELAMGAINSEGERVLNKDIIEQLHISNYDIALAAQKELRNLRLREKLYRNELKPESIIGKQVILVDDGVATGSSMQAAIQMLRKFHPRTITVAIPVAPFEVIEYLKHFVTNVICLYAPEPFLSVGRWYRNFSPIEDHEVKDILTRSHFVTAEATTVTEAVPSEA